MAQWAPLALGELRRHVEEAVNGVYPRGAEDLAARFRLHARLRDPAFAPPYDAAA